ncbi:MAG: hypothetical protein IAE78_28345 [Myxococcus sp.]|nr:hypothetical protein [Myxococcus sp.]
MPTPPKRSLAEATTLTAAEAAKTPELRDHLHGPPRATEVIDGHLVVDGDLSLDGEGPGLLVRGDLTVKGNVVNLDGTVGRPLVVTGALKAANLVAGGAEVVVLGATTVKNAVLAHYNDGTLKLKGLVTARAVINDDHHTELDGGVDAALIDTRGHFPRADFGPSGIKNALNPRLLDEDGGMDLEKTMDHVLANKNPLVKGATPTRILIEQEVRKVASAGPVTTLDLSDRELAEVPEALLELEDLEVLSLESNPIEALPEGFGRLRALRELNLRATRLRDLSPVAKCKSLERLNVVYAWLKSLTGLDLPKLRWLHCGQRDLKLNAPLGDLPALEHLEIWGGAGPYTPTIAELPSLTELVIHGGSSSRLLEFPAFVLGMSRLRVLELRGSPFPQIPDGLLGLTALERLDLGCSLGHVEGGRLPDLGKLPRLRSLGFDGHMINSNDRDPKPTMIGQILQLERLEELELCRWGSHEKGKHLAVPDELFNGLPNLRRLDFSFNYVPKLPESLFALKHLSFVDLRATGLKPEEREGVAARLPGVEIRWS